MNLFRDIDFLVGVPVLYFLRFFSFKKRVTPNKPQKILIIKLAALGDTLLAGVVLKALREKFPNLDIHWLVSTINEEMAREIPYVNRLIKWDKKINFSIISLIRKLRTEKYDVVIDLEQWSRGSAILAYLTWSPEVWGFETPGQCRSFLFTKKVLKKFNQHEIEDFFDLVSYLGPLDRKTSFSILIPSRGEAELARFESEFKSNNQKKIIFHPGCGQDGLPREWPLVDYAVLGHWLIKKFDAKIFLTGSRVERGKTGELNKLLNNRAIDFGGQLSLWGTLALLKRADLIVSGNTGIMHAAAFLQKKQIALHGPTDPKIWGPINPYALVISSNCSQCPCLKLGFEYHSQNQSCMKKIPIEVVKEAVEKSFIVS